MRASVARFRRLFRHFLASLVDNDLISPAEDLHSPIAGALSVLVVSFGAAALLFLGKYDSVRYVEVSGVFRPSQYQDYAEKVAMALDDKALLIGGAMLVMALVTVFLWDFLGVDERDRRIFGPLPLRPAPVLLAKSAAVAVAATVAAVALNILPAVLFPIVVLAKVNVGLPTLLRWVAAQAVAGVAGCIFVFLTLASLRGLAGVVLPARLSRRVLPAVQFVAILGLLSLLLASPLLAAKTRAMVEAGSRSLVFYPPLWFLGIEEVLIGRKVALFSSMAHVGLKALAWAALSAGAVHASLLLVRRQNSNGETDRVSLLASGGLERVADLIAPRGCRRASFLLTARTLTRSRRHRVYLAGSLGAGLAVAGATIGAAYSNIPFWRGTLDLTSMALAAQLNLLFFLIVGVRLSAAIPSDVDAGWVFRYHATPALHDHLAGTKAAIFCTAVAPLLLALASLHVLVWSWYAAAVHLVFGLVAAVVLLDVAFAECTKLPFVSALTPGRTPVSLRLPLYALGYVVLVYVAPALEQLLIRRRHLLSTYAVVFALALAKVVASRSTAFKRDRMPDFESTVGDLQQLGLENFVGTSRMIAFDSSGAAEAGASRDTLATARLFASLRSREIRPLRTSAASVALARVAEHVREDFRYAVRRLRRDRP